MWIAISILGVLVGVVLLIFLLGYLALQRSLKEDIQLSQTFAYESLKNRGPCPYGMIWLKVQDPPLPGSYGQSTRHTPYRRSVVRDIQKYIADLGYDQYNTIRESPDDSDLFVTLLRFIDTNEAQEQLHRFQCMIFAYLRAGRLESRGYRVRLMATSTYHDDWEVLLAPDDLHRYANMPGYRLSELAYDPDFKAA